MVPQQSPGTLPLQVVNAGRSSSMAADNITGCLPDIWQFCKPIPADNYTNLMCPSVAYRRPVTRMVNKLAQVLQSRPSQNIANGVPCMLTYLGTIPRVTRHRLKTWYHAMHNVLSHLNCTLACAFDSSLRLCISLHCQLAHHLITHPIPPPPLMAPTLMMY